MSEFMSEFLLGYKSYNAGNTLNAKEMRKNTTMAEAKMWQEFLKFRPLWYKFIRQKPIGPFILDFYCSKLFLAVELDGNVHINKKVYDQERTTYLVNQWISVARYWNNDILHHPEWTYNDLLIFIYELQKEKIKKIKSPPDKGDLGGLKTKIN